jgi:3-oxoacyl-[acyl-carrier protein] reductase
VLGADRVNDRVTPPWLTRADFMVLSAVGIEERSERMDLGLKGRVAVVTGASSGLGRAAAERFAREGAHVVICARTAAKLADAAREISEATGSEVVPVPADVTNAGEVRTLVRAAVDRFGRLDVLVANAGGPPSGGFEHFADDLAPYRDAIELNLLSTVALCQAAVPEMRRNAWGRIVAVTSLSAKQPTPSLLLSSVARAGVLAFTKSLASELAEEGITVNSVCPGYTLTDRLSELAEAEAGRHKLEPRDIYDLWVKEIPAKRLAEPAEFADVVAFLASERASYVTGVALAVDGGFIKSLI